MKGILAKLSLMLELLRFETIQSTLPSRCQWTNHPEYGAQTTGRVATGRGRRDYSTLLNNLENQFLKNAQIRPASKFELEGNAGNSP